MNLKYTLKLLAFLMLAILTNITFAQEVITLKLIDKSNGEPIVGAAYKYRVQTGTSDKNGNVRIALVKDETIRFSHITYGTWELSSDQLQQAIKDGKIIREESVVSLYPVTVIGLHTTDKETLTLNYNDKLSHDGGEVLNQYPAIGGIRKSGNYGFDPVLRGFKYEQLNIVLNGCQSAIAACPNRMDPPTSQMAPNMMDRVEILKGPHALRYGNAFGGTINYVAASPKFTEKPDFYGRLSGGYENNGELLRTETQVGLSTKRIDFSLFGAWSQGNDYKDGNGNDVSANFQRYSLGTNLGLKFSTHQQLVLSAHRNVANDVDFPALPMDLRSDDTYVLNARHQYQFTDRSIKTWNTIVFGTFVDHVMDNLSKKIEPRMANAETKATTKTLGARTETKWNFSGNTFYLGADYKLENAAGKRTREMLMGMQAGIIMTDNAWQDGTIKKTGVFAEYHYPVAGINFVISGRLELNESSIADAEEKFTGMYDETDKKQLNPAVSLGGVKALGNKYSVGIWLGRAQRSGSLVERFINYFPVGNDPYELVGNPQLKAESNNQLDVNLNYKGSLTNISIDLFAAYLQNYISSTIDTSLNPVIMSSPGVRQFVNIDNAFKTGFEFSWNQQYFATVGHMFNVAYTYAQDLEHDEPLPEIAPLDLRYTLYAQFFDKKMKPEISLRYAMEQDRISEEFGETPTPEFVLVDVKVSYTINNQMMILGGVRNLLDETYYEHLTRSVSGSNSPVYAPGRSFYVSFNLKFL